MAVEREKEREREKGECSRALWWSDESRGTSRWKRDLRVVYPRTIVSCWICSVLCDCSRGPVTDLLNLALFLRAKSKN